LSILPGVGVAADIQKIQALAAFRAMPRSLHSDVLGDGAIAKQFHIDVSRSTELSDGLVIDSAALFAAFRDTADGKPPTSITNQVGVAVDAQFRIDLDGAGVLEIGAKGWRFAHSALLASDPERRITALEAALTRHTLCNRDAKELRNFVANPQFADDDFPHVLRALASSPESFTERLRAKLAIRDVGEEDLLPDDIRLWEHLTAPIEMSATLGDFTNTELTAERRCRISQSPLKAFETIFLTCGAPDLVPKAMLATLDTEAVLDILESALRFDDHFSLVSAFEICADCIEKDERFIAVGDRLLDRVVKDFSWIKNACDLFATAFIVVTARLALHETLRERPVYWRRLAATSLSSLIVRTCGVGEGEHKDLLTWAINICGDEYMLSVYNDMVAEPQWRPEWLDTRFLAGDAFGRLYGAFLAIQVRSQPESWRSRIEAAKHLADGDGLSLLMTFPAVLQGERRASRPTLQQLGGDIGAAYRSLIAEPSVDKLLFLTPIIYTYGPPDGINSAVRKVLDDIRSSDDEIDGDTVQATIVMACHIAAMTSDSKLADAIADMAIELLLKEQEPGLVRQMFYRLIETAAANPSRDVALGALASRLEFIAFRLPVSEAMIDFLNLLRTLQFVEPKLTPQVGRALAAAKLAAHRA
jgi:hypothetical protein